MVQIIQEKRKPSFGENFSNAIGGVGQILGDYYGKQNSAKKLGFDPAVFDLPEQAQAQYFKEAFSEPKENEKFKQQLLDNQKSYDIVKKNFGEKFADVWNSAPVGGKTELLKYGMDAMSRGENVSQLFKDVDIPQPQNEFNQEIDNNQKPVQSKTGEIPKDFKWPDFSKKPLGFTNKEWADEKRTWRKENAPIYESNKQKIIANKKDELAIKNLGKLSPKLPKGFGKLIINPETGEPYAIAQLAGVVSPEVQSWIKETARFQNRAKDAFGSRVTNFDLVSYMKQFPGLLNSEEGRSKILSMMKINNKLDLLYDNALKNVYQKYGLSGISQEDADRLASSMIEDETENLRNEYLSINDEIESGLYQKETELSGRIIDVIGPDGQEYEIDESEVDQLPEGYRIV